MFGKFKARLSAQRLIDEQLYAQVAIELKAEDIKTGLWAKATADAEGNESKINPLYIKYRVQAIKDETRVLNVIANEVKVVKTINQTPTPTEKNIVEKSSEKETQPQEDMQSEKAINQENVRLDIVFFLLVFIFVFVILSMILVAGSMSN